MFRPSNWPLPVCVEHVVAEGCKIGAFFGHAPCQVDEVANGVVCGYVVRFHGRVVSRSPPVLRLPLLVFLHDWEGSCRQELLGRGVEEHIAATDVGQGRPIRRRPQQADHSTQPLLLDQLVQQLFGVLRRGGALQPALHILPVAPADFLDVLGVAQAAPCPPCRGRW